MNYSNYDTCSLSLRGDSLISEISRCHITLWANTFSVYFIYCFCVHGHSIGWRERHWEIGAEFSEETLCMDLLPALPECCCCLCAVNHTCQRHSHLCLLFSGHKGRGKTDGFVARLFLIMHMLLYPLWTSQLSAERQVFTSFDRRHDLAPPFLWY